MEFIISVIIGYFLGSISFSYLITKKIAKIDIRQHGSGNAGATNTLRVLGKGPAITVLLLDAIKGMAAIFLVKFLLHGNDLTSVTAGVMAVIGHNWPVFFGFRGGKGIATTIGVMATLSWISALLAGIVTTAIIVWKRYVSLGSLVYVILVPLFMYLFDKPSAYIWGSVIISVLAFFKHYENVIRLFQGKERKIGDSQTPKL